jgi:hypothetical protein
MKLLGGLEYVLPLREAFIREVIVVVVASPVMHRCPAIMTRDCKSPQPLMYAIQGTMESNPKGRIRLCIGQGPVWIRVSEFWRQSMVEIGNVSNAKGMRYSCQSREGWRSTLPGSGPLTGSSVRSVPAKYRFAECLSSNIESWVHLAVEGASRGKRLPQCGQKLRVETCSTGAP